MPATLRAPRPTFLTSLPAWRKKYWALEFGVLGCVAMALAFWVAIQIRLEAASTAAVTVWVVANTRASHVVAKSIARVLGTLVGACGGVTMVAMFSGQPNGLFFALAVWVGLCTALGNMTSLYRSYFALLAGYTASFVVLGAYHAPDRVLLVALDRSAAIIIGVLAAALIVSLFGYKQSAEDWLTALDRLHLECLKALKKVGDQVSLSSFRLDLAKAYTSAETLKEFADLEKPGIPHQVHASQVLTQFLLDLLDFAELLGRCNGLANLEMRKAWDRLLGMLDLTQGHPNDASLLHLHTELNELRNAIDQSVGRRSPSLAALNKLLEKWSLNLHPKAIDRVLLPAPLVLQSHGLLFHFTRTFVGVSLALLFWKFTGWTEGPNFIINISAFCALASPAPRSNLVILTFGIAFLVATLFGFLVKFILLPFAFNYLTFILCLSAVILPLTYLSAIKNPFCRVIGSTNGIFILAMMMPGNHMTYDPTSFLNLGLSSIFGSLFLLPVYGILPSANPKKLAQKTLKSWQEALLQIQSPLWPKRVPAWRLEGFHRLIQVHSASGASPEALREADLLFSRGSHLLRLQSMHRHAEGTKKRQVQELIERFQSPENASKPFSSALRPELQFYADTLLS